MYKLNGTYIYSPSDLITFMESDYVSWMDRFYLECPEAVRPDEDEETDRIIQAKGEEHERTFLAELLADGHDVVDLPRRQRYGDNHPRHEGWPPNHLPGKAGVR